jgi:DoxX-like protein
MTKRANAILWTMQILLALLFLFAGGAKLVLSPEQLQVPPSIPIAFLKFIGVCEVLGGIGLVLPALVGIQPWLTPLAAGGLVIIMAGAVVVTALTAPVAQALFPLFVGLLLTWVIYGRRPFWHTIRAR